MEANVDSVILVYAFRYALGRQTGAVIDIIDSIISNLDNIEEKYKCIMISEASKYIEDNKDSEYTPKDIIERWNGFVVKLYQSLKYNESKDWLINPLGGEMTNETVEKLSKEN